MLDTKKLLLGTLMLLVCGVPLLGQQFGGNPASLHWRQIRTDSLQIIFPEGLDSTAVSVAGVIREEQRHPLHTLGSRFRRVPIVLQNQTTNTNGYVGLGPFRSEYYLMSPMDALPLGSQDWARNLAVHEYRHVQQYNNFDRGWSHVLKVLFGDNGQALANDVAVPDWFFEGDAVYNETSLSGQGRGRLPLFMNSFPIQEKEGRHYHYQKLRNGSYKDFVPDHYHLGYLLVAYGYAHYGPSFWRAVTGDAAAYRSLIYPFQQAIRKETGLSFKAFREAAFADFQNKWAALDWKEPVFLTHSPPGQVADHKYPYYDSTYGLIYLKETRNKVHTFVRLKDGREKTVATAPISRDDYFGYNNGRLVYTRFSPDPRWSYREFSDLVVLNLATGQQRRLTRRQRYFTPDIAHRYGWVAASLVTVNGSGGLVVLDSTGTVLWQLPAPGGHLYSYPKFTEDDRRLVFLDRDPKGYMAVKSWDFSGRQQQDPLSEGEQQKVKTLLPSGNRILGYPVVDRHTLLFTSSNRGKDEAWSLQLPATSSDTLRQVAKAVRLASLIRGSYQATRTHEGLVSSVFTSSGYQLAVIGTAAATDTGSRNKEEAVAPVISGADRADLAADTLTLLYLDKGKKNLDKKAHNRNLLQTPASVTDTTAFGISAYPRLTHPFHFHSLQPTADDPNYGITLYGQNILNTVQTSLYYQYNRVDETAQLGGNWILGAWYLQPFVNLNYTFNRWADDANGQQYFYNELTGQLGLQLPLNFSGGRWYRNLYLSASVNESHLYWQQPMDGRPLETMRFLYSRAQFSVLSQQALQQIYPEWGAVLYGEADQGVDHQGGYQWMSQATAYLPGIISTHSLRLSAAYQHRDTAGSYYYSNNFPFSRGYVRLNFPEMWKWGIDYDLPLCYPDVGFANICYFSRFRANLFYDQSYGYLPHQSAASFGSFGATILADIRLGNQYPLTFGLRYSHLNSKTYPGKNDWELILPVHIF